MKEHENNMEAIDKLFKQSLEDYCPAPPPEVESALLQKFTLNPSVWERLTRYLNLNTLFITAVIVTITASVYIFTQKREIKPSELKSDKTTEINIPADKQMVITENSNKLYGKSEHAIDTEKSGLKSSGQELLSEKVNSRKSSVLTDRMSEPEPENNDKNINLLIDNALPPDKNGSSEEYIINQELSETGKMNAAIESPVAKVDIYPDQIENKPDTGIQPDQNNESDNGLANSPDVKRKNEKLFGYNVSLLPSFGGIFQQSREVNIFYGGQINAGIIYRPIHLGLETGLGFEKYTDRGGYEFTYLKTDTLGITLDTTWIIQDSTWFPVVTTTYQTDTNQFSEVTETRLSYSYFTVPLYLTKQLYENNIFKLSIKTGTNLIFLSSKSEPIPSENTALGNLISESSHYYNRNKLVWQWVISPQILIHLNRNFYFQIEPTYRRFLNDLYIGEYKPAGTPNPFSINAGIRLEW